MSIMPKRVLGHTMTVVGSFCALGIVLVILDLVRLLPEVSEQWWQPEQSSGLQGDMSYVLARSMCVDFGYVTQVGWFGYLGGFVWMVTAIVRIARARRKGLSMTPLERVVFATLCALLCASLALVHLTPLHYPHYNLFLL